MWFIALFRLYMSKNWLVKFFRTIPTEPAENLTMDPTYDLPQFFDVKGISIPTIGLGTFQGDDGNDKVKSVVLQALKIGYRHIDTAAAYGNEREVGEAIEESGVPRQEIFVTTKLYTNLFPIVTRSLIELCRAQTWHAPADVEEALDKSLGLLKLQYGYW